MAWAHIYHWTIKENNGVDRMNEYALMKKCVLGETDGVQYADHMKKDRNVIGVLDWQEKGKICLSVIGGAPNYHF